MNNQELLYHYFSNSLTTEQEALFQSLLEKDAAFKEQFEFEKNLKKVITSHKSDTLKEKLKGFEKDLSGNDTTRIEFFDSETKKSKSNIFSYQNFAIAASIALLVGWFGYNSFFGTNYNSMYNDNFSEYPNTVYTITRGDTNNSLEREAFVAYESKDYQTAIEKWDAITAASSKDYFHFYKAQSYLGLQDLENAKVFFQKNIQENKSFEAESTWYLALIALKEKDKKQAITYLEKIVSNYDYNKDKAQTLLEKLK